MQTMRRGGSPFVADVWRLELASTAKASSQGRASEMPAVRRKVRRGIVMGGFSVPTLLGLKHLASHDLLNQRPESIVLGADVADNRFDLRLVRRCRRGTGGVSQQLLRQ